MTGGEIDGDRTRDTQGHNLVLYRLSYNLRGGKCLPDRRDRVNHAVGTARLAARIFTNDLLRISSSVSPVASASCSVTAPHAIPRRK